MPATKPLKVTWLDHTYEYQCGQWSGGEEDIREFFTSITNRVLQDYSPAHGEPSYLVGRAIAAAVPSAEIEYPPIEPLPKGAVY